MRSLDERGRNVISELLYTDNAIHHHGVLDPGTAFIENPFSQVSLTKKIREVLESE